ncbi:MAG: hypothetical protein F4107_08550 [Gemmatimonadetes bacterium]|nr:hypothetical protein [Gemmatimonadota bacterium]MYD13975.1 hypothetical protein [Gemmatimonadota bacterium]MYI65966.1 hypothetical protein [Gemmatimonadota bacterium]
MQDDAKWRAFPGLGSVSGSGGEAAEEEIDAFDGTFKIAGDPGVPSLSLTISRFLPQHATVKYVRMKALAGQPLIWRFTTREEVLLTTEAAIASATGAVTYSGDGTTGGNLDNHDEFGPGTVIVVGAKKEVIDTIGDDGAMIVDPKPSGDIAKATAKLVRPALRLGPLTAKARSYGAFEAATGGVLASSLELTPSSALPDWTIQ